MKTKRDLINDNSESIVWHEAEIRVIEQLMDAYVEQFTPNGKMKIKTAESILADHTREHFAMNSNVYEAKSDIIKAVEEYGNQFKYDLVNVDEKLKKLELKLNYETYGNSMPSLWYAFFELKESIELINKERR